MNVDDLFNKIGRQSVEADLLRRELLEKQERINELESQVATLVDAATSKASETQLAEEG